MKTVIIKRNAYGKGQHKFNEQFRDFAQKHCGMQLKVCKPYRAQTKGKVERFNHYFRYSPYPTELPKRDGNIVNISMRI